jgi:hypothetical protein
MGWSFGIVVVLPGTAPLAPLVDAGSVGHHQLR